MECTEKYRQDHQQLGFQRVEQAEERRLRQVLEYNKQKARHLPRYHHRVRMYVYIYVCMYVYVKTFLRSRP